MARPPSIAFMIGEDSGDQLGAALMDAIRRARPDAQFAGLAGERMQARGMVSWFAISELAVMGVTDVLRSLPRIVRRAWQAVDAVLRLDPDVLVIVDSPDFTHAVAKRVRRRRPELPIIDYVSPSVWAWRPGRAARMARYVDHVLALLPFEPEAHLRLGGPACTYVGHPLLERLDELRGKGARVLPAVNPVLLVLPGSRRSEITRLLPPFGEAVQRIAAERPDTEMLLPAVAHLKEAIEAEVARWPVRPRILLGEAEKLAAFRRAHAALAASGTVALELGLAGVPMVITYRLDPLAQPFKGLLRAPSFVLTNLILGENVVPEFLDAAGSPEVLAREVLALLQPTPQRERQLAALSRLPAAMHVDMPASKRAASIVLAAAEQRRAQRRDEIGT